MNVRGDAVWRGDRFIVFDKAEWCAISNWGQDPRQLEGYPNVNWLCLGVTGYRKTDVTD